MPIYQGSNPNLFDTRLCNCYSYFNDAFRNLEVFLETYIKTKLLKGSIQDKLIDEIRRDFLTAFIILGDDDRNVAEYREVFMQYAFIGCLLQDTSHAARFSAQRVGERRAYDSAGAELCFRLAKAAESPGVPVKIREEDISGIGNLAMFAAMVRNIAVCESRDYLQLSPADFLLRFILTSAPEQSPLRNHIGGFSWLNLPEDVIMSQSRLFRAALGEARGELDVGKRYALKCLLNSSREYALDAETAGYYKLGYECYNQLYEETTRILDARAHEFELFCLYGGADGSLPDTRHFKRLRKSFASESSLKDFVAATFNKISFSKYEVDMISEYKDDTGLISCLLGQMYFFRPIGKAGADLYGTRKIKMVCENYPRVLVADYASYSNDAVNYYWLPEIPERVLNMDDTEFYQPSHIEKLTHRTVQLTVTKDGMEGLKALEEPFLGMFMYAYALAFNGRMHRQDFFNDNYMFTELVRYLRNLPRIVGKQTASHILQHADIMSKEDAAAYVEPALNQLIFIAPDAETLSLIIAQRQAPGRSVLALLDMLELTSDDLETVLTPPEIVKLVSALIDRQCGTIFYHPVVAEYLDKHFDRRGGTDGDERLYLSASYMTHGFKSGLPVNPLLISEDSDMFITSKLERREFDESFFKAFDNLWHREQKDSAFGILWKMLAAGHSPVYARLEPYVRQMLTGVADADRYKSVVLHEFLLYCRLTRGILPAPAEAETMRALYRAQNVFTARSKAVAEAINADDSLVEEMIAFEWVNVSPEWTDVELSASDYSNAINPERENTPNGEFTHIFYVGYTNVCQLSYTDGGKRKTLLLRRGFANNPRERAVIFKNAGTYNANNADSSADFLLLSGRICVDAAIFNLPILVEYIAHISSHSGTRAECQRAVTFVITDLNALTKAVLYLPRKVDIAAMLKRLFSLCFTFWSDIKKHISLRQFFAYIRSLEAIAGTDRVLDLHDYLVDQILHNPHIKPDLSEEYSAGFR